jgi:hypothetical protein
MVGDESGPDGGRLLEDGALINAGLNVLGSLAAAILVAWLGFRLALALLVPWLRRSPRSGSCLRTNRIIPFRCVFCGRWLSRAGQDKCRMSIRGG